MPCILCATIDSGCYSDPVWDHPAIHLKIKPIGIDMNKVPLFHCTQPCSNCPYRTDAPLKHWHKEEFQKVLDAENDYLGKTFLCHKKNGSMCIGWLMKQAENNLPSIMLRISLSKHNVDSTYLDSLYSPAPLYKDVKAMIKANFPQLLRKKSTSL